MDKKERPSYGCPSQRRHQSNQHERSRGGDQEWGWGADGGSLNASEEVLKKEAGDKDSEIWLLGDSNPKNWQAVLETPLDPRHPARHSIWTPVLEVIQDRVFREYRSRVDTSSIYVRNAIEDPAGKPRSSSIEWETVLEKEIRGFQEEVREHRPRMLFSFGAFAFEFARRVLGEEPRRSYSYWGARRLGHEFRQRVDQFDLSVTNLLPLLHVSIARGRFIQSHEHYCNQERGNYFEFVGNRIAQKLIEHRDKLRVWIE